MIGTPMIIRDTFLANHVWIRTEKTGTHGASAGATRNEMQSAKSSHRFSDMSEITWQEEIVFVRRVRPVALGRGPSSAGAMVSRSASSVRLNEAFV